MENFTIKTLSADGPRMYCGPTVLALLTGKSRAEIHRDVNKLKRKLGYKTHKRTEDRSGRVWFKRVPWNLNNPVKGMYNNHLEKIMVKYGLSPKWVNKKYPSLRQLVADMGHFNQPIVVNVTNHYVLYFQGKVYDTYKKDGAPVEEHPSGLKRVKCCWIIQKQPKQLFDAPAVEEQPAPVKQSKPKKDVKTIRYERARAALKRWTAKRKRAEKAEKKALAKVRYYEKTLGINN